MSAQHLGPNRADGMGVAKAIYSTIAEADVWPEVVIATPNGHRFDVGAVNLSADGTCLVITGTDSDGGEA